MMWNNLKKVKPANRQKCIVIEHDQDITVKLWNADTEEFVDKFYHPECDCGGESYSIESHQVKGWIEYPGDFTK